MRSLSLTRLSSLASTSSKRTIFFLVMTLLAASEALLAQDNPAVTTCGLRNGRAWITWTQSAKVVYLVGISDAGVREEAQSGTKSMLRDYFTAKATYAEIASGIDKIYEDSANAMLPIMDALSAFCERANGLSPTKLEEELARLRRQWRERGCEK
jgi:hypothetical protein